MEYSLRKGYKKDIALLVFIPYPLPGHRLARRGIIQLPKQNPCLISSH
jgi:hypothetical protein